MENRSDVLGDGDAGLVEITGELAGFDGTTEREDQKGANGVGDDASDIEPPQSDQLSDVGFPQGDLTLIGNPEGFRAYMARLGRGRERRPKPKGDS